MRHEDLREGTRRAAQKSARKLETRLTPGEKSNIVHVIEYVWGAARALFGESNAEAEKWVEHRLHAFLAGRSGGDVAKTIRWWEARDEKLDAAAHAAIDETCRYLADRTRTRLLRHLERDRERNHASRYEDGKIPDPLPVPKAKAQEGQVIDLLGLQPRRRRAAPRAVSDLLEEVRDFPGDAVRPP